MTVTCPENTKRKMSDQNIEQPDSKKLKMTVEPIIFTLRRCEPDVRLYVFDRVYHVHSTVLKVGSEFFQKYLEPSGGVMPTSTSSHFKSNWHTKIDDDGSWHLSSDPSTGEYDISKLKGSYHGEMQAFHKLLCIIFNRECKVDDAAELILMTERADYYRALPALSNSVSSILFNNPGLFTTIRNDPASLLVSAYKLRHKVLFKECLILCLAPWSKPRYKDLNEPCLYSLADPAYLEMSQEINSVWLQFIRCAAIDQHGLAAVEAFFEECSYTPKINSQRLS